MGQKLDANVLKVFAEPVTYFKIIMSFTQLGPFCYNKFPVILHCYPSLCS